MPINKNNDRSALDSPLEGIVEGNVVRLRHFGMNFVW